MISKLAIKNFKCLLDVEVNLAPFTVLIGPNDSGKSSLLDALHLLGKTAKEPFAQVFAGDLALDNLVWMRDVNREISWTVSGEALRHCFEYHLAVPAHGQWPLAEKLLFDAKPVLQFHSESGRAIGQFNPGPQVQGFQQFEVQQGLSVLCSAQGYSWQPPATSTPFLDVAKALRSTTKYKLDTEALRHDAALEINPELTSTGSNLVAVLDAIMSAPDRTAINNIEQALRDWIPTLQGISLAKTQPDMKTLRFSLAGASKPPKTIPASLASDGSVLITAFLALAYGDTPDLIFIEEPENGLHYSLLGQVIDLLRKISRGEVGNRPRQVIVTTHSPLLLNFASPEEVLVCQRGDSGGTIITPMSEVPDLDRLLREFAPGELWYLLGEERMVKGGQS